MLLKPFHSKVWAFPRERPSQAHSSTQAMNQGRFIITGDLRTICQPNIIESIVGTYYVVAAFLDVPEFALQVPEFALQVPITLLSCTRMANAGLSYMQIPANPSQP